MTFLHSISSLVFCPRVSHSWQITSYIQLYNYFITNLHTYVVRLCSHTFSIDGQPFLFYSLLFIFPLSFFPHHIRHQHVHWRREGRKGGNTLTFPTAPHQTTMHCYTHNIHYYYLVSWCLFTSSSSSFIRERIIVICSLAFALCGTFSSSFLSKIRQGGRKVNPLVHYCCTAVAIFLLVHSLNRFLCCCVGCFFIWSVAIIMVLNRFKAVVHTDGMHRYEEKKSFWLCRYANMFIPGKNSLFVYHYCVILSYLFWCFRSVWIFFLVPLSFFWYNTLNKFTFLVDVFFFFTACISFLSLSRNCVKSRRRREKMERMLEGKIMSAHFTTSEPTNRKWWWGSMTVITMHFFSATPFSPLFSSSLNPIVFGWYTSLIIL